MSSVVAASPFAVVIPPPTSRHREAIGPLPPGLSGGPRP